MPVTEDDPAPLPSIKEFPAEMPAPAGDADWAVSAAKEFPAEEPAPAGIADWTTPSDPRRKNGRKGASAPICRVKNISPVGGSNGFGCLLGTDGNEGILGGKGKATGGSTPSTTDSGATVDVETTTITTLEGSASASGRFPWSKSYSLLRLFSILALFCLGAAFAHSSYSATAALLSSQRYDWPWPRAAAAPPPPTPLLHLAASANELPKEQPEGEPTLADGCRYVFLDVGSNIGNHVRFLYEAEKFPGSSYAKIFNETFPVNRGRPDVCAFGWEANSAHVPWLNRLQQAYKQQGWLAHWFAPVAVADKDGTIEFWHVNDTSHNEWGYSMRHLGAGFKEVVRAMDLARWINAHVHRRRVPDAIREDDPPPAVVMKMDIEGSEFSVLPSLMATGAMCSISYLTVEYHCAGSPKKKDKCHIKKKHLKDALDSVHKECPGNVKKLKASQLDDEAYAVNSIPLPRAQDTSDLETSAMNVALPKSDLTRYLTDNIRRPARRHFPQRAHSTGRA